MKRKNIALLGLSLLFIAINAVASVDSGSIRVFSESIATFGIIIGLAGCIISVVNEVINLHGESHQKEGLNDE